MKYVVTDEDVERAFAAMDAEFRKHFPAKIDSEDKALAIAGIRAALESFAQTLGEPVAVPDGMIERLRVAARALVRERKVYAEDIETIGDVVKLLESFAQCNDDFDPFTATRDAVLKAMPHTDDLSIRKTRNAQTWQQVLNNIDLLGHYAKENAAPHNPTTEKGCE